MSNIQGPNQNLPKVPIQRKAAVEETEKRDFSSKSAAEIASTKPKGLPETEKQPQKQQEFVPRRGPLTSEDIANQLMKLQKTPTGENKQILMTMLAHGVEANPEIFESISNLIKGSQKKNLLEAAVIAASKGLETSSKGTHILSQFLAGNTEVTKNIKRLQESIQKFSQVLTSQKGLMDSGLYTGLNGVMGELYKELNKWTQEPLSPQALLKGLKRNGLIRNIKLFEEFLGGLADKFGKLPKKFAQNIALLNGTIESLRRELTGTLETLTLQLILSKNAKAAIIGQEEFAYWQFPNPFVQGRHAIDILIKKDKQKKVPVSPEKTKIILRFETPDLGEVSVIIELNNRKLSYVFHTHTGEAKTLVAETSKDLKDNMEKLNYEVVSVQTIQKPIQIKKILLPTLNLDKMTRIITEA